MTSDIERLLRWDIISKADLGSWVHPEAIQWAIFFEKAYIAQKNEFSQFNIDGLNLIIPYLRGFEFNNRDTISITTTYNLCHVTIHDHLNAIDMLDCFLMDECGWLERYHYALGKRK